MGNKKAMKIINSILRCNFLFDVFSLLFTKEVTVLSVRFSLSRDLISQYLRCFDRFHYPRDFTRFYACQIIELAFFLFCTNFYYGQEILDEFYNAEVRNECFVRQETKTRVFTSFTVPRFVFSRAKRFAFE